MRAGFCLCPESWLLNVCQQVTALNPELKVLFSETGYLGGDKAQAPEDLQGQRGRQPCSSSRRTRAGWMISKEVWKSWSSDKAVTDSLYVPPLLLRGLQGW